MVSGHSRAQMEYDLDYPVGPEVLLHVSRTDRQGQTGKGGDQRNHEPSQLLILEGDLLIVHLFAPAETSQKKNDSSHNIQVGKGIEIEISLFPGRLYIRETQSEKARKTGAEHDDGEYGYTVIENFF